MVEVELSDGLVLQWQSAYLVQVSMEVENDLCSIIAEAYFDVGWIGGYRVLRGDNPNIGEAALVSSTKRDPHCF